MLRFENIKNNIVLLRADLNDSIENGVLIDHKRIDATINTIFELINKGNKIVLISHLSDSEASLDIVANYINNHFTDGEFQFIKSINREEISIYIKNNINSDKNSKIILLENLRRFDLGVEEKCDDVFAKWLSSLSDIFVFDAFSVAHRRHASVINICNYMPHCLGPIAITEENHLHKIKSEKGNTLFIIGGAKISTKLSLIENLLNNNATVYLGGAMANTILYLRGIDIRNSKIEKDIIIDENILNHKNLILPQEYIWGNVENKHTEDMILDIKVNSNTLEELINNHNNIVWNGPMGLYEKEYYNGTFEIIELLNNRKGKNIIAGGGDTIVCVDEWQNRNNNNFNISYISLSGGAMLTYIEEGGLMGLEKNK